jgi:hypothetical protein
VIGRLVVRRARIRRLVIDELVILRLRVLDPERSALPDDLPDVIDPAGGQDAQKASGCAPRAD